MFIIKFQKILSFYYKIFFQVWYKTISQKRKNIYEKKMFLNPLWLWHHGPISWLLHALAACELKFQVCLGYTFISRIWVRYSRLYCAHYHAKLRQCKHSLNSNPILCKYFNSNFVFKCHKHNRLIFSHGSRVQHCKTI
jgi:hypothetical protein